jgi:hypothetical protein
MMAAAACARSTLLVPLVLRPNPPVIVRDLACNVVIELVVGFDGVARKIGTVARVATFRHPKIVDERIWRQTIYPRLFVSETERDSFGQVQPDIRR